MFKCIDKTYCVLLTSVRPRLRCQHAESNFPFEYTVHQHVLNMLKVSGNLLNGTPLCLSTSSFNLLNVTATHAESNSLKAS